MEIHLVDGTYELFRNHFGYPPARSPTGQEVGATLGLARTLLALVSSGGATHVGIAFDHVIESFRNDLFSGYKTGDGVDSVLLAQFELAERAARSLGFVVWPMVEFEADDALATGAHLYGGHEDVDRVWLCTPDKDLAQAVMGDRVVCLDRRRKKVLDEPAVCAKFGVPPASIPDYLALVGDAADGIPGLPGFGPKSASTLLARYAHIEGIPRSSGEWVAPPRGAPALAATLEERFEDALLYRRLATLRRDVPIREAPGDLLWRGAKRDEVQALCEDLGDEALSERVHRWE